MPIRARLQRLLRRSERDIISMPQPDGPPARFPQSALKDAFLANTRRICGEDVPAHPLSDAATRSPDPEWRDSFMATMPVSEGVEDLSE